MSSHGDLFVLFNLYTVFCFAAGFAILEKQSIILCKRHFKRIETVSVLYVDLDYQR